MCKRCCAAYRTVHRRRLPDAGVWANAVERIRAKWEHAMDNARNIPLTPDEEDPPPRTGTGRRAKSPSEPWKSVARDR